MSAEELIRASWQASSTPTPLPSLDELRSRSDRFRRTIRRRNMIEYIAGAFVLACFGAIAVFVPIPVLKIGSVMVVLGTLYVLWQLHRRGSLLPPTEHGGEQSVLESQRRELVRQRDAVASVFSWYLLPLIPGLLVILASPWLMMPVEEWRWPPLEVALQIGFAPVLFGAIWLLNQVAARRLQKEIDVIDALRGE